MAVEIKLVKEDSGAVWGFRLTGGANSELPLTIIKVGEGSFAEKCGLQVGDVIVKINDDDITFLSHAQAHDKIVQAENSLTFSIIRSEISDMLRLLIQAEDDDQQQVSNDNDVNHEVEIFLEGSVPIYYPEKTLEDLIKNIEANNEENLPTHDLNLTDEEIHSIINPEIVTKKEKPVAVMGPPAKAKLEPPIVLKPAVVEEKPFNAPITTENVKLMQSHVIEEINNNLKEGVNEGEKKWSTFLQKPQRAVPPSMPKFEPLKSTYRVKIRTKKDLEEERAAKEAELEAEALRQKKLAEQIACKADDNQENVQQEGSDTSDENISDDLSFTFSDSDNITEETITFTSSGTEPTISFTESLNSLEGKLEKVKEQLQVHNVDIVPDNLQKLLAKIASQLEKIVKVVKPQANGLQNVDGESDATDEDADYDDFSDEESSLCSLDSRISTPTPSTPSYQGTEPTLTFSSSSIMSDPPSATTPEGTEPSLTFSDEHVDMAECDRTECDVTEMHEYQDEHDQAPEKQAEEKTNKKEKASRMESGEPQGPLARPIILPGGRKWCAPDDAARAAPTRRHPSLTDERIDATISSYYEKIDGKTVGSNTGIVSGRGRTSRSQSIENPIAACCLAKSPRQRMFFKLTLRTLTSLESLYHYIDILVDQRINFLKYQPPPKNLDHLKNSEVYKMVHNMEPEEGSGIFGRPEKVLSEQDYHVNSNKSPMST